MTLFLRSYHVRVNTNVPCCEYFHFIFDIHDRCSYPWRFKCKPAMNQVQLLAGDPHRSYDVIAGCENVYANNLLNYVTFAFGLLISDVTL